MTEQEFIDEVNDFMRLYCLDYAKNAKITSIECKDDFYAEIKIEFNGGYVFNIVLELDNNGDLSIPCDDNGNHVIADGYSLYAWLFFGALELLEDKDK